ncbi:flagellar biosynthesis protein FlhA [Aquicoccus porphyridii]|uniref:Flagellar biosynthesis protein FlhA n=1 Tax=Aquicoccus porphyridii TaxID=1852029 RepID=A0A5A9YXR7_9RHOB|nr:flagellar biosynthesis protein FlhA [Aquicoccus porphyridii]KAA0909639.1 flagellar biosynthesis protein FlhA [Aquicoccus porphyridii]RAI54473.1 flagellar biosynthesis protein FlhA [Rhodobacteraceae bacterium AsT-22]
MIRNIFQPTVLLAMALMAIIVMMILPMPAWVLDSGLAVSFALAILVFTITLFIQSPLEFSSFPTILLASLMLRLSLNVSSTKLIIGEGHSGTGAAGDVIAGFAEFVMGGNMFLGLVVFGVLLIVNFMVITKGAARMAEVGARFALDGMPGKQLAIDSDMSAGAIDHTEAKARREKEQLETTFFGSLDGASKFVKGDAVAGLLITILNLVMGLAMGVLVHGMAPGDAFEVYAILTVGDGLVSQIPAVIISIASALLLARGGATGATDFTLFTQLGNYPPALVAVGGLMMLFALFPGLPFVPFFIGAVTLIGIGLMLMRRRAAADAAPEPMPDAKPHESTIGDLLDLDDIHVEFASDLVNMVLDPGNGLDARIANMRNHVARSFGLVISEIRLTDAPSLPRGTYVIKIHGVEQVRSELHPGKILALEPEGAGGTEIAGIRVEEPVYGAPAKWIDPEDQEKAIMHDMTTVTPVEVLATHLLETIKRNLSRLLTLKALRRLLDEMVNLSSPARNEANKRLLQELVPDKVPTDLMQAVLRLLLDEQVSIRNLPLILEAIAEGRVRHGQPEAICEFVRQKLGFQLVAGLRRADGTLPLVQLAPDWEDTFTTYQIGEDGDGADVALPPDVFNRLTEAVSKAVSDAAAAGNYPALITSVRRRRFLRTLLKARSIPNPVLSFEEVGVEARPALVGTVAA